LDSLHLHDSLIEEIRYSPELAELSLRISVCRYEGDGLGPIDAEVIRFLVFSDVRAFAVKRCDPGPRAHDEILSTKVEQLPDESTVTEFYLGGGYGWGIATLHVIAASAEVRDR
jgi:hypothetical protein